MKRTTCIFYSFDEFRSLLSRTVFTNGENFSIEVRDCYFWRAVIFDPNLDDSREDPYISDFDALEGLSKLVGMKLVNTHVSHDGIWLEGEPMLPRVNSHQKK